MVVTDQSKDGNPVIYLQKYSNCSMVTTLYYFSRVFDKIMIHKHSFNIFRLQCVSRNWQSHSGLQLPWSAWLHPLHSAINVHWWLHSLGWQNLYTITKTSAHAMKDSTLTKREKVMNEGRRKEPQKSYWIMQGCSTSKLVEEQALL